MGRSTFIPSLTPPDDPGRLTTSVRDAMPASPRDKIADGTPAAAPADRSASAMPGISRSMTRRVISGVWSVGVSPVPPVVTATSYPAVTESRSTCSTASPSGITGAKRTPDLIPLCHPLAIHGVSVDLSVEDSGVAITASVRTADRTGVEMEALTSVSVAALTLIDMIKSVDKGAVITDVRLEAKDGGKSGTWRRT